MPTSLSDCAKLLSTAGIRHHFDAEEAAIRVVFVTRYYTNPRGERLAVVRIEAPDGGRRLRSSIERAFPTGGDPAASCLALCRLAADAPLVGVEFDPERADLRLVAETAVEDGRLTKSQLLATVDALVEAADACHVALRRGRAGRHRRPVRKEPDAA